MTLTPQDRIAIAEINTAFAALLDERRFSEVALLFCDDAVLHRADGSVVEGRDNIQVAQSARHANVQTVHHLSMPFVEALGENEARARTSFVAVSINTADQSTQGWTMGYFEDRFRRDADGWRIALRRICPVNRR